MTTFSFENLKAWQKARILTKEIYSLTADFPETERFGLTSQLRRASVSICSNLAEGSSRFSIKDRKRFYEIAFGSSVEVVNQLIISTDIGLISPNHLMELREKVAEVNKLISGLVRAL